MTGSWGCGEGSPHTQALSGTRVVNALLLAGVTCCCMWDDHSLGCHTSQATRQNVWLAWLLPQEMCGTRDWALRSQNWLIQVCCL